MCFRKFVRAMSTLTSIPDVDIESNGVFKYILIKVIFFEDIFENFSHFVFNLFKTSTF